MSPDRVEHVEGLHLDLLLKMVALTNFNAKMNSLKEVNTPNLFSIRNNRMIFSYQKLSRIQHRICRILPRIPFQKTSSANGLSNIRYFPKHLKVCVFK